MVSVKEEISQFITDNFLFGEADEKLTDESSLLEQGIIDSTGVLELVMFLETRYRIQIKDNELVPANLDSLNQMVRFIGRKIEVPTK